jgi:glyoxylase-like metal-dependent hydrolase (beta-lactamase superfamily II)
MSVTLGDVKIVALCDGHFALATHEVLHAHACDLDTLLADGDLPRVIPSHVNAFLVDDGKHVTLIDTGAGDLQDPTLGNVLAAHEGAGYPASAIDTILLTHLHGDHAGGLCRAGQATYPNAEVYIARDEAAFWLPGAAQPRMAVDPSVQATFADAHAMLAPYMAEGRVRFFDPGTCWHGAITAHPLPGHTPGHTGFCLDTGDGIVMFCGDLFHVVTLQVSQPSVTVCYDADPAQAARARSRFLAAAACSGYTVAAAHAPFPGLGRIHAVEGGHAWQGWAAA